MRKMIATVVVLADVASLSACGSAPVAPKPTATATASTTATVAAFMPGVLSRAGVSKTVFCAEWYYNGRAPLIAEAAGPAADAGISETELVSGLNAYCA